MAGGIWEIMSCQDICPGDAAYPPTEKSCQTERGPAELLFAVAVPLRELLLDAFSYASLQPPPPLPLSPGGEDPHPLGSASTSRVPAKRGEPLWAGAHVSLPGRGSVLVQVLAIWRTAAPGSLWVKTWEGLACCRCSIRPKCWASLRCSQQGRWRSLDEVSLTRVLPSFGRAQLLCR